MSNQKILVVDDSPVVVKTIEMKLSMAGYQVLIAREGGDAVGIARKEKPDLIVLDINFPPDSANTGGVAWDGFLIMQWLRRLEEAKNTPIIIITGADPGKFHDKAMALGATAFFAKPVNHEKLLEEIQKALEASSAAVA